MVIIIQSSGFGLMDPTLFYQFLSVLLFGTTLMKRLATLVSTFLAALDLSKVAFGAVHKLHNVTEGGAPIMV